MKESKKILMSVLAVVAILGFAFLSFAPSVLADGTTGVDATFPSATGTIDTVDKAVGNVWGTVLTIAQILAFAAIVFAGVRYMFASADQKADIKQGLIYLVIGAVLVFAASTVVQVILKAANEVAPTSEINVETDYIA